MLLGISFERGADKLSYDDKVDRYGTLHGHFSCPV